MQNKKEIGNKKYSPSFLQDMSPLVNIIVPQHKHFFGDGKAFNLAQIVTCHGLTGLGV